MKILSVTTRNFRNLPDQTWALDEKFQAITGLNEAGKSSLLEAIVVGLYVDATSTDSRYEQMRRWKSPAHIQVTLDFILGNCHGTIDRDFENRKNTLTVDQKPIRAKDKVRSWFEQHLPLPSEQAFLQTACIKQNEINCDIDASDLRTQIEQHSLSATGKDIEDLTRALDTSVRELQKGMSHPARNPGPIKQLSDELARLQRELADLQGKETEANQALVEYEQVAAQVEKLEADLSRDEEHLRLDKEFLEAERVYRQGSGEIPGLKAKIDRLNVLPQLLGAAQTKHEELLASLEEHKARREKAQSWLRTRSELTECERSLAELTGDIGQLKTCDTQMQALENPLQSTHIVPEDFSRFRTLQRQLTECKSELDREKAEVNELGAELEGAKAKLASYAGPGVELNGAMERLRSEKVTAQQVTDAYRNRESLTQEKTKLAAKLDQINTLELENTAVAQELAPYKTLEGIDARSFRAALSSAEALDGALKDEGIGFEIDPARPIQVTIQVDGGISESITLEQARKFTARREILAQVPGLGTLRLTNESQTSRKLAQRREEITSTLAKASVEKPEDLLCRFEYRDELMDHLTASTAKLQTALESRPLGVWQERMMGLDEQLVKLSDRISKHGATRELSAIEEDLQNSQRKLNQLAADTVKAQTQIQQFTRQLNTLGERIIGRENRLATLQSETVRLLKQAGQENETGLNALEQAYLDYQARLSAIEMRKAQILKGRLETHIYSLRAAEETRALKLRQELERLAPDALPEEKLKELGAQIEGLERDVRAVGDEVAGLRHENELLKADQLEKKFAETMTQVTIADAKRKENEAYAFAIPGERIDFSRRIERFRTDLSSLLRKRAELKVKSDAVGVGQSRIAELRETIADQEHQLQRLKQRFETDTSVLEYLRKARDKAFADLLAAIPSGVGELFGRITAGKYARVEGAGFTLQPWSAAKEGTLELDEMSGGTSDQFYLSLRLEALRAIFPDELPPFILDDALVSADPQRRAAILSILEEHSVKGQVIFLTCQEWPELTKYPSLHLG
jgi:exonuclease SbcC